MWTEIKRDEAAKQEVFAAAVRQGAGHYSSYNAGRAKDYLLAFDGALYWYNDGTYRIALAMYVVPGKQQIKIANCLVGQINQRNGTPEECLKITMRKIREYMDLKGIRYAYALTPNSSFTTFQDLFHAAIDSMVWEHTKVLEKNNDSFPNGIWRRTIDRNPLLKSQDELWVNGVA